MLVFDCSARLVDGDEPPLVLDIGIQLNLGPKPLDRGDAEVILRRAARDEVLRGLVVSVGYLEPLPRRKMIGEPRLAALVFAPDPISHELAVVGIAISLNDLDINILAITAEAGVGIGRDRFRAQVELGSAREMREIEAGAEGGVAWRGDRKDVVVHFGISVESEPFRQIGQTP